MNTSAKRLHSQLFDADAFADELSAGAPPLALFRETLKNHAQRLRESFDSGVPVVDLVQGRARLVDELLQHAWHLNVAADANAALVAVGGYGRGELHPASDIDLMVLVADSDPDYLREPLEHLLVFLWDIGLEVGHSVRSVDECVREAKQDLSVVTNLMEARLLAGSQPLFERMREATAPGRIWDSREFFAAKRREQTQRYSKYDDTAYNLEPNIKGSPGGLRDIQMIAWVAKRHFAAETMHALVAHGFLTEEEYTTLERGQDLLWKIRFALHTLTGRREDRLLFDYQRTLATQFGYRDQAHSLAVEQFMQGYYRTVMELGRLNEMLLQHFEEAILYGDKLQDPVPINNRFQSRSGFLEVVDDAVFQLYPAALLELFFLLETHPELKGVRASTIRLIRRNCHLIDDHFRNSLAARSLFMEIIRQPSGLTHVLRRMNRYGILAAYIPAFGNIVGRMQYDLFHVYTVDEHTLFLVRNLRRFAVPEHGQEFPLCSRIIRTLPKPELLYLAALFHDIAKGRGGDHSQLGAQDALAFCQQHDLSNPDARLVSWLVEKHLLLSMTAQRKDISDPDVIQAFAEQVADTVRLDYLYLLTVADARATNPKRWNSWRDALLRELYLEARKALVRGLRNPQAQDDIIQEKQVEALRLLQQQGFDADQAMRLWLNLGSEYFLLNHPEEIAWHSEVIQTAPAGEGPLVRIRAQTARGGTEVFIYGPDHDGLFAMTTALLDQLGFDIMDARIITADDGSTMNSFLVLDEYGSPVSDPLRQDEIIRYLEAGLQDIENFTLKISRRPARQLKHFPTTTNLSFTSDPRHSRTILRLVTADRPGLLAQVGRAFAHCGVRVQNAKISTIGAETDDIFFITDRDNQPLRAEEQFTCLEQALRRFIDGETRSKTDSGLEVTIS